MKYVMKCKRKTYVKKDNLKILLSDKNINNGEKFIKYVETNKEYLKSNILKTWGQLKFLWQRYPIFFEDTNTNRFMVSEVNDKLLSLNCGFRYVDKKGYDSVFNIDDKEIKISLKSSIKIINQNKRMVNNIIFSNLNGSTDELTHLQNTYSDVLIFLQYGYNKDMFIPVCCGLIDRKSYLPYIIKRKTGYNLSIPYKSITWIISPYDNLTYNDIKTDENIGELFTNYLDSYCKFKGNNI